MSPVMARLSDKLGQCSKSSAISGYPGRGADVTGTVAPDPIRPWASFNHLMAIAASVTPAARCPAIRDVSLNRNRQLTVAFSL